MVRSVFVLSCKPVLIAWLSCFLLSYAGAGQVLGGEVSGAILAIRFYQKYISDLRYGNCRFDPGCSEHAVQAIRHHGYLRGTALALDRLVRCNQSARRFYKRSSDGKLLDRVGRESFTPESPKVTAAFLPILENGLTPPFDFSAYDSVSFDATTLERLQEYRAFAEFLVQECDCERAATEYRRIAFLGDNPVLDVWTQMRIAGCYFQQEQWDASAGEFLKLTIQKGVGLGEKRLARLMAATCFFNNGQYLRCRKALSGPVDTASVKTSGIYGSELLRRTEEELDLSYGRASLLALCEMGCGQWDDAALALDNTVREFPGSPYEEKTLLLSEAARRGGGLSQRNSKLATALSVLIPGSGQVYAGRALDGLRHFVVNGLLFYGVYRLAHDKNHSGAYLLAGVAVPFYLGNVMGAGAAAGDFNRQTRAKFLAAEIRRIQNKTGADFLAPKQ